MDSNAALICIDNMADYCDSADDGRRKHLSAVVCAREDHWHSVYILTPSTYCRPFLCGVPYPCISNLNPLVSGYHTDMPVPTDGSEGAA